MSMGVTGLEGSRQVWRALESLERERERELERCCRQREKSQQGEKIKSGVGEEGRQVQVAASVAQNHGELDTGVWRTWFPEMRGSFRRVYS